ncbi:Serine/threonine-protein phosphatase 1 [Maioricimonas rarisocia]|uniref:Serine/threonine-protein phosphatase 1 n=1 Tax=Maioricimonas rarisocia TaxID=2528026 RepID=A0A517Z3N2_9PLAN|nr:metallophosphoesterase family protein [Maioricimonas rarisocia]QDU37091.1 Serine/threonine-protein phosphatase 1 [Maioricimonas rarisocia]
MPERTIAIGDIHGYDVPLEALINELSPTADDTVVVLGDVVDRGPNTRRCIELLLDLRERCRLVFILGNHEEMMLSARSDPRVAESWLGFGGRDVVDSYDGDLDNMPQEHWDFLRSGREHFETERDIFVHAGVIDDLPLDQQPTDVLRWMKTSGFEPEHESGKRVICGHTAQKSGIPKSWPGWVCIDTCVYCDRGRLTALDATQDLLYQADHEGNIFGPADL